MNARQAKWADYCLELRHGRPRWARWWLLKLLDTEAH